MGLTISAESNIQYGGGGSLSPANSGYGIEVDADGKINKTTLYNEETYFLYYAFIFIDNGINNIKGIQNVSDESNILNEMFGGVASFIDTCEKIKKGYDYRTSFRNILFNIEFYNVLVEDGLYVLGYNIYLFGSDYKYTSNVCIVVDISEDSIELTINGYKKVQESLSEINHGNGITITPEVESINESEYIPPKIAIDESIVATHQSVDQKISTRFAQTSAQGSAVMYYRYTGGTYQLSPAKPTTNENAPFTLVGTALTSRTFSGTLTGAGAFNPKASYVKVFNLTGLRAESTYTIKCDYTLKGIAIYTETRTFVTANNETSRLFEFVIPSESTYATPFTFAAGDSVQEVISISCSNGNNHTVNLANVISTNNYSFTQRNGGVVYADEVFDASLNKTQSELNCKRYVLNGILDLNTSSTDSIIKEVFGGGTLFHNLIVDLKSQKNIDVVDCKYYRFARPFFVYFEDRTVDNAIHFTFVRGTTLIKLVVNENKTSQMFSIIEYVDKLLIS